LLTKEKIFLHHLRHHQSQRMVNIWQRVLISFILKKLQYTLFCSWFEVVFFQLCFDWIQFRNPEINFRISFLIISGQSIFFLTPKYSRIVLLFSFDRKILKFTNFKSFFARVILASLQSSYFFLGVNPIKD